MRCKLPLKETKFSEGQQGRPRGSDHLRQFPNGGILHAAFKIFSKRDPHVRAYPRQFGHTHHAVRRKPARIFAPAIDAESMRGQPSQYPAALLAIAERRVPAHPLQNRGGL